MTAPPDRLGAHDRCAARACRIQQTRHALTKSFALHIVGIAAKRLVAPCHVSRIRFCASTATKFGKMMVLDSDGEKRCKQVLLVELRMTMRTRNAADVGEKFDLKGVQRLN